MLVRISGRTQLRFWICLFLLLAAAPSCRKPAPTYRIVAGKEGYTHTIAEGETLESIAERYYGDADFGKALGEYNAVDPLDPLKVGNTLLVPFDKTELKEIRSVQDAQMFYNRGTVLARTGQYEDAVFYLERAVETSPAHIDAWYNLALAHQRLGNRTEAQDILKRLANSFPSEKTYRYSLGAVLREGGNLKEAVRLFQDALELDPLYGEARYALALTLEDLGKTDEARREWETYLALDPDSVWSEEARLHLKDLESR